MTVARSLMPLLLTLSASLFLAAAPISASPLAAERWNKRVVLVFAGREDANLKTQVEDLLADKAALAEREMLVVAVVGDRVSAAFGAMHGIATADALREAYAVAPDAPFTMILIGKDGGEKLRQSKPVPAKDVFALIDGMPMRRNEARN